MIVEVEMRWDRTEPVPRGVVPLPGTQAVSRGCLMSVRSSRKIKFCSILANIMSWYVVIWQQYWPGTVPLASLYRCSSSHEGWQPSPHSRPVESCSSSQSHSRNPSNKASSYRRLQLTGRIEQILKTNPRTRRRKKQKKNYQIELPLPNKLRKTSINK